MIKKIFVKIHKAKSKFIMKALQVRKQEEFWKGGRRFLKLKKMRGEEETIIYTQSKSWVTEKYNQPKSNTWHYEVNVEFSSFGLRTKQA